MRNRIVISLISSGIALGVLGAQNTPVLKHVPLNRTSVTSGAEMFSQYCAVCHGVDGKGAGPAAVALKKQPTDLTQLAARNRGVYPELSVLETLSAKSLPAHGSQEMPMWGDLLKSLGGTERDLVHLRLVNLIAHVKSLQAK
jgi:mono/diheme cytochrome c family protein